MIKITHVEGRCILMDGFTSRKPQPGMEIRTTSSDKVYVLMTGPMGKITLAFRTKTLTLRANSMLRIRGNLAPEFANRPGTWDEAMLWVGKLWAKIRGPEPFEEIIGNVAVGIRG